MSHVDIGPGNAQVCCASQCNKEDSVLKIPHIVLA